MVREEKVVVKFERWTGGLDACRKGKKKSCSENSVDDTGSELDGKSVTGARREYYEEKENVPGVYLGQGCTSTSATWRH